AVIHQSIENVPQDTQAVQAMNLDAHVFQPIRESQMRACRFLRQLFVTLFPAQRSRAGQLPNGVSLALQTERICSPLAAVFSGTFLHVWARFEALLPMGGGHS